MSRVSTNSEISLLPKSEIRDLKLLVGQPLSIEKFFFFFNEFSYQKGLVHFRVGLRSEDCFARVFSTNDLLIIACCH